MEALEQLTFDNFESK